jgi:hypothetical protein
MSLGNGKLKHGGTMRPCTADEIALAQALEERFLNLCGSHLRIRGCELPIPPSLDKDFFRWRELRVRHRRGDFRCCDDEVLAVRTICQWTVDVNCVLRNQPTKKIDWGN